MMYLLFIIYIICSALGMVLIKNGGLSTGIDLNKVGIGFNFSWMFLVGTILYVASFILWMIILQKFPLTYISPISYGIMFIVMSILSYFILSETITAMQIVGIITIIIGVVICTIGKQ